MIESILTRRQVAFGKKITVKTLVSVGIVALAVLLPQLMHLVAGAQAGVRFLPMYLPVLLAGCLLGPVWGLGVGILAPIASYLVTSAFGDPMPALARLPFMVAELAVFAFVSGMFSKKIAENAWFALPAVLLGEIAGRAFFLLSVVIFQNVSVLKPAMILSQIRAGWAGLLINAMVVPAVVALVKVLSDREKKND